MKSKWLISLGLVVCLLMAFGLPMCAPAPAPPVEEEELAPYIKVYMSASPEHNVDICKRIKEAIGVEVRQTFTSCGETHAKLKAEAPNFRVDMCIDACGPQMLDAKKNGWSIPYDSPVWQEIGPEFKDPDHYWVADSLYSVIPVGNKDLLDKAGYTMPESWDDFLDPKWKGEIVMPSAITSGNGFMALFTIMTLYGFNEGLTGEAAEAAGWKYLEALDENMHHYTKGGSDPIDLVGRGEFMLGLGQDSSILARIELGYPIVWKVPKEGIGYDICGSFILKGTKNEYTCQKIIDVTGSVEYAEYTASLGNVTPRPEAPSALYGEIPEYVPNLALAWALENKPRLLDEWKARFVLE